MWNQYTMELVSWWVLFAGALGLGLALANDDDSSGPSEPEVDPRLEPFQLYDDFDADDYDEITVGTPNNDELFAQPKVPTAINGGEGNDAIQGSDKDDYILGGGGRDAIDPGDGDDIIRGGAGRDQIIARDGDDTIYGEADGDVLNGSPGDDLVSGGDGDDLIIGWTGADTVLGDAGNDTISGFRQIREIPNLQIDEEADILDGGDGNDRLGLSHGDTGTGGAGNDEFITDWRTNEKLDSVTITDFNAKEDKIALLVNPPAEGEELPEITQKASDDGVDRLIYMNGVEVMRVVGAGAGDDLKIETITEAPTS